jgi:3-deoxy-D-manno-octulosonic acid (KDO) 8-phosphate synthase
MEVHETPSQAKSDAQNVLKLDLLPALLEKLVKIHEVRLTLGATEARG